MGKCIFYNEIQQYNYDFSGKFKMSNKKLRKRDRAWNALKIGAKTSQKGFQKVKAVISTVKWIINISFLSLKETYFLKRENQFNTEYGSIKDLSRTTKKVPLMLFTAK